MRLRLFLLEELLRTMGLKGEFQINKMRKVLKCRKASLGIPIVVMLLLAMRSNWGLINES